MSTTTAKKFDLKTMCLLALFIAIEFLFRIIGLGRVPVGPLNMSFMTVPIAVGAILLGPVSGAVLGMEFGLFSLYDAISGGGGMTAVFFSVDPFNTVMLCVVMRTLMGLCAGLIFRVMKKPDHTNIVSYYISALAAPLLNTVFFMGYIVLFFYQTEYVQNLVTKLGAANPLMFIILLVGVQGLVESLVCTAVGGSVAKGVAVATGKTR